MGKKVGAEYLGDQKVNFTVWSPTAESVEVLLKEKEKSEPLEKDEKGYWSATIENVEPESHYKFRVNKEDELPDPASRSQPEGVHSWSRIIDPKFSWNSTSWKGRDIEDMIIYELHVGTFTSEGTFEAVIEKLDHLKELGVNTLEIMPISQFPGERNWGYDGVYPFAAQHSYGGAKGLKKLVDACHQREFSVLLDVVYNHLGPEGNYLSQFGPYFTEKYHTPWGSALNFDEEYSDPVRNHFIQNALMWLDEFRIDGLRLDAVHEIIDLGARHMLKELSEEVDALEERTGRKLTLIAESDLNDTKLIKDYEKGGYGLEGQWVDDFHHAVHTLLTGEDAGYYSDYGRIEYLAKSFKQAFIYDGKYSSFRKKTVGNSPRGLPPSKFVTCIQNHDQVGNRLLGERLSKLVSFEKQKLAAGVLLSAPFVPMLFMGEEFAENNPFQYFVSHGDPDLVKAVQEGRKREFEYFNKVEGEDFPDPQATETFEHSMLNWDFKKDEKQNSIFEFYKEMLNFRKQGAFHLFKNTELKTEVDEQRKRLKIEAAGAEGSLLAFYNFGSELWEIEEHTDEDLRIVIASADKKWRGKNRSEEFISDGSIKVPSESFLILNK